MLSARELRERRKRRVRSNIKRFGRDRMRLSVFRSHQHIYAQIIDDVEGVTRAHASSLDPELRETLKSGADKAAAVEVGKLIARRAGEAGIKEVVFDRGGYLYHGRVQALADAARESGLSF